MQPPSSYEDGLDGRRERFCLLIFNCLSKAMVFFFTTGETSRALLAQQQVRHFPNLSRIQTTGCFYINYCPRSNFLAWILQNVYCHSSNRSSIAFPPKRTMQFSLWHQRSRLAPIILGNLLIGRGQQHFASCRRT